MTEKTKIGSSKLVTRREANGYLFIFPWLIGVTLFFLYPFIQSVYYAFCDLSFSENGLEKNYIGMENFRVVLFENPKVFQKIVDSVTQTLTDLIMITTLSFLLAIILNQKFRGRLFARAVFSLPLIVSTGVLLSIFKTSIFAEAQVGAQETTIFQAAGIEKLLESSGIGQRLIEAVVGWVNGLVDTLWKSGVQIIIFLSGIQSIPPSYYEVCNIEGATAWQSFWSVTFPIMMPFCFINIIYTIIDSFTFSGNAVMGQILTYFQDMQYAFSNALALIYFVIIGVITAVIAKLVSARIVYIDK